MNESDHVLIWDCFAFFYHYDRMNACVHKNAASVKYSPITFRLAETIQRNLYERQVEWKNYRNELQDVLSHKDRYELDMGR